MLIKEYRIPLPLTVEEYRIAQLYMIAKKSREESSGEGSGVEILVNEPYENGPGGKGQYTQKIYHVGSHLPGWFKSLLPKSALTVSEEAWNAYPYTKTRFTCPFVEKFSLEIETYYFADNGHQDNVFKLSGSDLKNRIVDLIDVVKDQLYGADYVREEDPKIFISQKCNRGPLSDSWLDDYWQEVKGRPQPTANGKSLMCAYKLCRVEFRYWGMQTKLEKFIHDVALRKTMLRAHRQAWAWQDEWYGLTMDDIREIERQTQLALQKKMAGDTSDDQDISEENSKSLAATMSSLEKNEDLATPITVKKSTAEKRIHKHLSPDSTPPSDHKSSPKSNLRSSSSDSIKSLQAQVASWRMETLVRESETETGSEDEFYDCESTLNKWSSMCSLDEGDIDVSPTQAEQSQEDSIFNPNFLKRVTSERSSRRAGLQSHQSIDGCPDTPVHGSCPTTVLLLVFHAGSVLDVNVDMTAKKSDVTTFKGAFESVMRQHYPTLVGHITIKLVSCPSICNEALGVLSTLSPYSFDCSPSTMETPSLTNELIPIGAIPLIATNSPEYADSVTRTISSANMVYNEFIKSDDGKGFNGQVCIVGDSMGSVLAYDALCRTVQYQSRHDSENSILDTEITIPNEPEQYLNKSHLQAPTPRRRSSTASDNQTKFEFEVSDFFTFGSPLSLILAARKIADDKVRDIIKPPAQQVYNLFHPTDPVASRLEPLLSARFTDLAPINVARYAKYPLGNGQPYHLMELIQSHPQLFGDHLQMPPTPILRRLSEASVQSTISGLVDNIPLITMNALQQKWWGSKRLDYALYCPEGLANFPTNALPHLFHASYWESSDVIAFILRQVGHFDLALYGHADDKESSMFKPGQEREKWMRKRTSVKLKNVAANHRANDVIVKEGCPQTFTARFMYGPLDMITLTGEKVDVHMIKDPPAGEWIHLSTVVTDKTGRITYTLSDKQSVGCGIYPMRVVVRGDQTSCNFHLAVVPPQTECIVFSIDGSFTASVSVTGRDPKVRAGAVDVVRFWQDLGYLIIYITGRPDMQQRKVVSWLAEHNFPHGLVFFSDGFSTDPLGHKAAHLNNLITEHGVILHAAYGSGKDISVYQHCGLSPRQIYAIGRISKKYNNLATVLNDGYAAHLADLKQPGIVRGARGNARLLVPRRLLAPKWCNARQKRCNDQIFWQHQGVETNCGGRGYDFYLKKVVDPRGSCAESPSSTDNNDAVISVTSSVQFCAFLVNPN